MTAPERMERADVARDHCTGCESRFPAGRPVASDGLCAGCTLDSAAVAAQQAAAASIAQARYPDATHAFLNQYGVFATVAGRVVEVGAADESAPFADLAKLARAAGDRPTGAPMILPARARDGLLPIGFWRAADHQRETARFASVAHMLPDPRDHVDGSWDPAEREAITLYLRDGRTLSTYRGCSQCRICDISVGCSDLTDDRYVWPEGFAHYVTEHNVRPPKEFVAYALARRTP